MQPPSTTPTLGEARSRERGHGYGLVLFASILLLVIGCFNLIYGIAAVAQSHVFVANAHYVFGNLRSWGWITLILGGLQLLDRKSTRLNSSHMSISYAVFCLKKKRKQNILQMLT